MRKDRQLSQADLGQRIGVNQKCVARIEGNPGVTSFDQIARIVSALGGRLVVEQESAAPSPHLTARRLPARRGKSDRVSKSAHTW